MRHLTLALLALLIAGPASAITLGQAQAEAEAWITPRLAGLTTDFENCAATKPLSSCHPTWSSTVLPNTTAASPALATVTNNDPGPFVSSVCGDCYDDTRDTWVIAGVDIPNSSPVQLRTNTFQAPGGVGIQVAIRFQYEGIIWERGYAMFGPAPNTGWVELATGP